MSICSLCHGVYTHAPKCPNIPKGDTTPLYFNTPEEHNRVLADAAIRALEQLSERWRCDQPTEQELAFVELTMRRIRQRMP